MSPGGPLRMAPEFRSSWWTGPADAVLTVYHGTTWLFAGAIREEGLRERPDPVFVTPERDYALAHARAMAEHFHAAHHGPRRGLVVEARVEVRRLSRNGAAAPELVVSGPIPPESITALSPVAVARTWAPSSWWASTRPVASS
jgi:hypothetical protein